MPDTRTCPTDFPSALAERASALVAACLIMLGLLFAQTLGADKLSAVAALTSADPLGVAASLFVKEHGTAAPADEQPKETPQADGVDIRLTSLDVDIEPEVAAKLIAITAEVLDKNVGVSLKGDGPKILIYHTHDTEAYTQTPEFSYEPSGDWRTKEQDRSVVAVGEELARLLREQYGIEVIHDTACHEPPLITAAYSRSLATMQSYKSRYPSLEMFIDLHRDGVSATGFEDDFVVIEGREVARLMFVVGTGRGATGQGTEPLPDFESNYALALGLTQKLLSYNERLARDVRVKSGRYNQQVSSKCILVEVGHNANTLEQALAAMPYLAAAIAEVAGVAPSAPPSFTP